MQVDSFVIGTAGHIDHGKTTLVKALTGFDADTLEEEKKRGITINLGFAYCKLPCGKTAGFVDVPGHERFVKNMLAGAGGIDVAMVIIALDEGVMPQTKEHIHILDFLEIKMSIIVFTKKNLADEDFRELVVEDTRDYVTGTFLEKAPQVMVDSVSGEGIDELLELLDEMARSAKTDRTSKNVRMPVDRAFSVKGYGTVVTGTLNQGKIKVGDELTVYPGAKNVKVRGIQVHEEPVDEAHAGQRTALNLAGVTVAEINRGSTLTAKGLYSLTKVLDLKFKMIKDAELPLGRMEQVKFYLGTAEVVGRIIPIDRKVVEAGETCYAKIVLDEEIIAQRNDRYVIRSISPVQTIGGGRVLNPQAQRKNKDAGAYLKTLKVRDLGSGAEILESFIWENPFANAKKIILLANLDGAEERISELKSTGKILVFDEDLVHINTMKEIGELAKTLLQSYSEKFPLREGMPKAEFQERLGFKENAREFENTLSWLVDTNMVKQVENAISLKDFAPKYTPEMEAVAESILSQVKDAGYTLLNESELSGGDSVREMVLEALLKTELMALEGRVIIARQDYERAKEEAAALAREFGTIKLSAFRDALDTSRKHALLLLEKMDGDKFTIRQDEDRNLL